MLQKLRIKFIVLAMSILFLVLSIIMGTINMLNYQHMVSSTDHILDIIIANDGKFPEKPDMKRRPFEPELSPELPFETRFFTIRIDTNGTILFLDTGKIAAVSDETAIAYAQQINASGRLHGFVTNYRYRVQTNDYGKMIVFQDCGRQLDAVNSFFRISITISLIGFLAVSLLLYIFSARIVKPIADSYEKQKQFITNASHDLKTPITIIDADLDVMEMEQGENEWMTDIRKQTQRLSGLIQELVYLSRMEEKENHYQMIDFPISDMVSETAQSFEALAVTQGKNFSVHVPPLLSYCGDEKALRHLVSILLDNALKYSEEQGTITLSLEKADRGLKLTVFNTCPAIKKENLNRLFERFYRGDKSRNSQTGGYGIGLSIAKAIVEAHRGTIKAETTDGHSLSIQVFFPQK